MLSMPACRSIANAHHDWIVESREFLEASVQTQLRHSPYSSLRRISCTLDNGVLVLRGRVPSYYLKQIAQNVAISVDGVSAVQNQLEVCPTSSILEGP